MKKKPYTLWDGLYLTNNHLEKCLTSPKILQNEKERHFSLYK
jgi:hypothetical protein